MMKYMITACLLLALLPGRAGSRKQQAVTEGQEENYKTIGIWIVEIF